MKKTILSLLILTGSATICKAQVSLIISKFSQNLSKSDLHFAGDRKLYAIGINDKNSENYFVISKNKAGAEHDELFVEKFTKKSEGQFVPSFLFKMTHPKNKSLAFVDNRASYIDVDKDGYYESLSVIDEHENGPDSDLIKITGLIIYKNTAYEVWVLADDDFTKNQYSSNFKNLPSAVSEHFLNFWNGLRKN